MMTWQRYRTIGWREYAASVTVFDWLKLAIGVVTLGAVLSLSVIIVRAVAEVSDFKGQFTGQLDGMKREILETVTNEREVRVAPLDQKVEKIEKTAKLADTRADQAERKAASLAKKQQHVEKVLAPVLANPRVVEELVPILVPSPQDATPVATPTPRVRKGGFQLW